MTRQEAATRSPTTQVPGAREVGSDFELVEDRYLVSTTSTRLPWEDSAGITYVQSGRQALACVAAELRNQGQSHLFVPSYLCDSMISPFLKDDWSLSELRLGSDLAVSPADLLSQVTTGVLLHTPYFGRQDSPSMLAALDTLRHRGVVVVVDETHRLFAGPSKVADIRVASLHKLLPVYDGGYVAGLAGQVQTSPADSSSRSEIAHLREMASISKSNALASGDGDNPHLAMFARVEPATEIHRQPAQISSKSLSLLYHLDMDLLRLARQANAIVLTQALGQSDRFRILNPPSPDLLPSHLVLETDDMTGLRRYLTAQRIYCPIHWPPSELLPRTEAWPNRYLSLPIDHRYGEPDMIRVATEVKMYFEADSRAHLRETG